MPLPEHIRADLDSRVADLANVTGQRWGGMLVAGTFLREFVPDGLAWAHLDIAGPSFHTGSPYGYTTKGGTGVPVRTLVAVLAGHRRAAAHTGRAAHYPRVQPTVSGAVPHSPGSAAAQDPLAGVVVAHALRVAHELHVVDGDGEAVGRASAPRRGPQPGAGSTRRRPRRAACRLRDRRARLDERLHPGVAARPLAQVIRLLGGVRRRRATPSPSTGSRPRSNARAGAFSPRDTGPHRLARVMTR